ncbi:MAG: peptide-methionine (R)-S-oxide reductase MsrB [Deltaproteobacteria bacterium]|nr:peptide-methionine (R)-S-oxide reductase MsrB [Deltaproteobacteria bacterium]
MTTTPKDPALDPSLDPRSLSDAEWQAILSPIEYRILRHSATERPGTGRYLDDDDAGAYHCAGCAQKLYGAEHKFHSGCGWPSFFQEIEPGALVEYRDTTHGMIRVEMRCARCDGHLGHIFEDAPHMPTGLRHCVNGFATVFVPEGADVTATFRRHRSNQEALGRAGV